jgi:hypothetical protein
MPTYEIEDPSTGRILTIEGEREPSQEDAARLFQEVSNPESDYSKGRVGSAGSSFMRTGGELFGGAVQGLNRLNQMLTGVPWGQDPEEYARQVGEARADAAIAAIRQSGGQASPQQIESARERAGAATGQQILSNTGISQFGANLQQGAREAFPVNPNYAEEFWAGSIPSGAGSIVSGALGGPLGIAALHGLSSGEAVAQRAIEQGVPENANTAFGFAAPITGVSEAVLGQGGRLISGLARPASGTVGRILAGGSKEAAQEAIEGAGQNLAVQQLVDPSQSVGEGITQNAAAGFVLGGGVAGVQGLGARRTAPVAPPTPAIQEAQFPAQQVEEPIADVESALSELDATGEQADAIQVEEPTEGVLRDEGILGEGGLQGVVQEDQPVQAAQEETPLTFEQDFPGGVLPETAEQPRYSLDDDQSPDAVMQRHPETFADPTYNQLPVEIQAPDGTVYAGVFNGYMDALSPDRKFITVPSIGRKQGTSWSHGSLRPGEKLLTPVPSEQQFREMRQKDQLPNFEAWGRENIPSTARQSVGESGASLTPESIQPAVERFQRENPSLPKINVVNDPNWRTPQGRGIRGESRAGSVTINTAFIKDEAQAMRVLREEAAHQLLLTPDGRTALSDFALRELPASEIAALKEKYRRQQGENASDYELRIVDEWMAQNEQEARSFIGRIIDKIKEWLENLGLRNLTNQEASRAVFRALRESNPGKASLTALRPLMARQSVDDAPPGQRFTGPTFDRSQAAYSNSARGEYEYLRQAPEGQANKRQLEYARNLVNFHGANYRAALNEINNIDPGAFQAVARAVLTAEIASQMGAPGTDSFNRLLPVLLQLEPQNQQQATDVGQALQSFKVVKDVLDPHAPLLSYLGLLKQRHTQAVDTYAGPETTADVHKGVAESTAAAGDLAADGITEADAAWKQVFREVWASNPVRSANIRSRIEAMFPLAGWREKFTDLGTKNLAKQFAELIGMEKPSRAGNIAEFDANIRRELGKKLKEAFAETGIKPPDKASKPSLESQIAAFIGSDPLKSDKLARVDERVREKIGDDPGLNMLWDFVAGGMSSNAPSFSTVRRIAADAMKALNVDRSRFMDDAYVAAQREAVVNEVSRMVREATLPEQTSGLNTADLEQAVGEVFDNIVATQRNILEAREVMRRAKEALRLGAEPERQVQQAIANFAKTQTDTPTWSRKQRSEIQQALTDFMSGKDSEEAFRSRLSEQGIGQGLSDTLINTANREKAIREAVRLARDREKGINKPDAEADAIVAQYAKTQSDTPSWLKKNQSPIRKIFADYMAWNETPASFRSKLAELGVGPAVVERLLSVANREQTIKQSIDRFNAEQAAQKKQNRVEMAEVFRRAKESLRLTAKPEQQAQSIIDQYAKTQTDTPTWTKPQENVIKAVFKNYLNWRETPASFRSKLKEAGLGDGLIERLLSVANREQSIKRTAERIKAAEDFQKWLNDDGKVQSLLRKAAERTGINWRELFRDLPENQEARRAMILERASKDPRVANLTPSSKTALAAALDRAWERQRTEYFRAAFARLVPLPKVTDPKVRDSIRETIPDMFKLANQGLLDNEAIRNQIAAKLGVEAFDGPTAKKLAELGQKAQRAPEGIIRNKFLQQAKTLIEDSQSIDPYELAKSFWYANVLSGTGTAATILTGSAGFGLLNTLGAALDTATALKRPDVAWRILGDFAKAIPEGARRFYDVVTTGDYSRFPEFNRMLKDNLEGRFRANEFEKLLRSPDWRKRLAGSPGLVQRFLTGADQLFSLGVRDAGAYYAALSRGDMESLGALMAKHDRNLTEQAKQQAIDEFKANGVTNPKPLDVRERQREILEQGVAQDIKEGADELGRVANLNQHPPGLGGKIYDFLVQIPFVARAALGGTFLRAGINLAANASNWNPVTGPINYARSSPAFRSYLEQRGVRPGVVDAFSPNLPPEQRRQVALKAAAGLAIATLVASRFLFKEHDDDEWEITGSFAGINPAQLRNLRQQGVQPNSIWKVDPETGKIRSVSYKEWPFAGAMAMVGAIRDAQLYKGREFNEETAMRQIANGSMAGFSYLTELPLLSQASRLFGVDSYGRSQDPAEGLERVGQAAQRAATGITSGTVPFSSLLKDIDTLADPNNYKPDNQDPGFGIVLRSIPFARRYAGKPELNIFGEPIQTERLPWSRIIRSQDNEPEMNLLASWMANGVNPVWPGRTSLIVDSEGVRRQMTEDEWYRYAQAYGQEFKATIRENIQSLRQMPLFIEEARAARAEEYGDISNQPYRMQQRIAAEIRDYGNTKSAEGWLRSVHSAVTKQIKANMGFGPAEESQ